MTLNEVRRVDPRDLRAMDVETQCQCQSQYAQYDRSSTSHEEAGREYLKKKAEREKRIALDPPRIHSSSEEAGFSIRTFSRKK